MRILTIILCMSFIFSGELEVEGDLKVTGNIEAGTIDSLQQTISAQQQQISELHALIAALQAQINYLSAQLGYTDCAGVIGGTDIIDECGVCGGNNESMDVCGTCDGLVLEIYDCECIDYDGNEYETVVIGTQNWMAQNLKTTHYKDGQEIMNANASMEDFNWTDGMGAYAYYNFDEDSYHDEHGLLYNAYVIENSSGICPINWHVPTDEEWKTLEIYLGMSDTEVNSTGWRGTDEGYKLKDIDFNGSNSSGFTALASGYRNFPSLEFISFGDVVFLWTSSISSSNEDDYWTRVLNYGSAQINRSSHHKYHGFPIRCVQDQ